VAEDWSSRDGGPKEGSAWEHRKSINEGGRFLLGRDRRLRSSREFGAILRTGSRAATALLTVTIAPAAGPGRIGISASAKLGGAVQRNRARRLVREYYRRTYRGSAPYDIVVNLKPEFAGLSAAQARSALDEALAKAISAGGRPGRRHDPVY
jgi:ribonuclease P protein component